MGTLGPGGVEAVCTRLPRSGVPAARKRTFRGTPAAQSQGLSPDRRRMPRRDQAPRRRLRRESRRWQAKVGLGNHPTSPSQRSPAACPRPASSYFPCRAIPTAAFRNGLRQRLRVPGIFCFASTRSVLHLNSVHPACNSASLRGLWV